MHVKAATRYEEYELCKHVCDGSLRVPTYFTMTYQMTQFLICF